MRNSDIMAMSIRMVKKRELESQYSQMVINIMENGILINKMDA